MVNQIFPSVSVIILNWNQKKLLSDCLRSVLLSDCPKMEVIVSDNGSTDGSVKLVKEQFPDVVLVENNANLGFCVGNNIAIRQAKGDIIIVLNNDTWVDKDWIKEISNAMSQSGVGVVGCKLLFGGTDVIQSLGYVSNIFGHHINRGLLKNNSETSNEKPVVDVDYVSGAALAIKRDVIDEIGSFDPLFFAYFEDTDLCYRAKEAGYRVVVATNAVVHHWGSVSWDALSFRKVYFTERNRFLFIFKHYYGLNLLKALTVHQLKFALWLIRTKLNVKKLTADLVSQKHTSVKTKKSSRYSRLAKAGLDWISAKFLAFLSIPLIVISLRRNKCRVN